jgi:mono/diheme cytochrome c family protein
MTFINTAFADGARETSSTAAASGTDDTLIVGERVFMARCNKCHPNGNAGVAPDLVGKPLPGPLVSSDAPGRHHVPPAELGPLVAFVASRGGGGTAALPVFVASQGADAGAGASFYSASCNKCHPGGKAGVAPSLVGKRLPGPLVVSTTFDGRHAVPAADWENLSAYLVTLGAVR